MLDRHQKNIRLQITVLIIGTLLLLLKFAAYFITNSNAILTDAFESIVNIVAAGIALYSLTLAKKPKDKNHPYGHGKIEFISAGIEGVMIITAGLIAIGKGGYNLIYPIAVQQLDIGLLLTVIAGLVNYLMGFFLVRQGKSSGSLVLVADGKHLISDALTSVGILIGLGVVYFTDLIWLDNVVAIIFGAVIVRTGIGVIRESYAGIMDEADYQLIRELIGILNKNRRENWIDIHNFRVIKYGSALHVDCHVTLPWYLDLKDAHAEIEAIEKLVNENFSNKVEFFIHMDPCIPSSCSICMKKDCAVRQRDFIQKVEWKLENVLPDQKHQ